MPEQAYFDRIASRYDAARDSWQHVYDAIKKEVEPLISGKDVIDVGSGGYFPYDVSGAGSVTAVDISKAMLDKITTPSVRRLLADARDLEGIEDGSADVMHYFLSIHHMTGRNVEEHFRTLDQVLDTAKRKLKPGGRLLIAEPTLSQFFFAAERFFFPLTKRVFSFFGSPPVFFYETNVLKRRISERFGMSAEKVRVKAMPMKGWVDLMGGTFPGLLKAPACFCPTRVVFFEAIKP